MYAPLSVEKHEPLTSLVPRDLISTIRRFVTLDAWREFPFARKAIFVTFYAFQSDFPNSPRHTRTLFSLCLEKIHCTYYFFDFTCVCVTYKYTSPSVQNGTSPLR